MVKPVLKDVVKQKIDSKPKSGVKTLAQKTRCIGDSSSDDDKPSPHTYIIFFN